MGSWGGITLRTVVIACIVTGLAGPAAAEVRALPVPRTTIYPGHVLSAEDLWNRQFRVTAQSIIGIATASDEIVGKQAQRRLLAGKPVPITALEEPILIKRGSQANAIYEEGGLSISIIVQALEDGSANDLIPIRVSETGKVLRARVRSDGTLDLGGS